MDLHHLLPLLSVFLLSCSGTTSGQNVTVKEGSEAVLRCSINPKRDIRQVDFDWRKVVQKDDKLNVFHYQKGLHYNNGLTGQHEQFNRRVSHFPDQLQSGDASIMITDTKLSDGGTYTCEFSPGQSDSQMFNIELVVAACPKPIINTHKATEHSVLLQCDVEGAFPKPTVEWQDSAGKKITDEEPLVTERDGRFYITFNTTMTEAGDFYCVATQMEFCNQLRTKAAVHIPESSTGIIVVTAVVAVLITLIVVGGILAVLVAKGCIPLNCKKSPQSEKDEEVDPTELLSHDQNHCVSSST